MMEAIMAVAKFGSIEGVERPIMFITSVFFWLELLSIGITFLRYIL